MERDRDLKKKLSQSVYGILGIALFTIVGIMLFITRKDVLFDNPVDFYDVYYDGDLAKDQYVELYVDGVVGNYAETQHTVNFIPTGTDQHYLIWLDDDTFISVAVKDKELISQLDKIADNTWAYINYETDYLDKSTTIKGVVESMDSEIQGYCNTWLDELEISRSNMTYLQIDTTETPKATLFYLLFCVLMVVVSIFLLVSSLKKEKEEDQRAAIMGDYRNMNMGEGIYDEAKQSFVSSDFGSSNYDGNSSFDNTSSGSSSGSGINEDMFK